MVAKRTLKFAVSLFIILITISGCSANPSLELISATVELNNDEGRLGSGEKEGEYVVPIALSYDFVLKNTSKTKLGEMEKLDKAKLKYNDGIELTIEPKEKLKKAIEEVMGINIFDEEEALGFGVLGSPVLEPDQEETYKLDFDLGALEENPVFQLAPPMEQLEKIEEHALDANLIVSIEGEEIARFELSDLD